MVRSTLVCSVLLWLGIHAAVQAGGSTPITWMVSIDFTRPAIEQLVADFRVAHPEIDLKLMWVPQTQYQTKFKTLAAAGQAPDLIDCGDVWVAYLRPFLMDLTPLVQRDAAELELDDFFPQVLSACQHEGRYYFLASSMNLSLLYYNKDLFDAAGVSYPTDRWTSDDFVAAAKKLTVKDPATGRVQSWGCDNVGGWWGEWLIHVRQHGGAFFNEDASKCLLDSPQAVAGLKFYFDKIYTHCFTAPPGRGPVNGFISGRVAMLYGGHVEQWRTFNAVPNLRWDVQVLPIGPAGRDGGEIAVGAFGVSKTCANPEAAWMLLKFITARDNMLREAQRGRMPVRQSVAKQVLLDPNRTTQPVNVQAVFKQIPFAKPIPRSPDFIEVALEVVQPEIDRMVQGDQSPEVTAQRAARAANRFLQVLGSQKDAEPQP